MTTIERSLVIEASLHRVWSKLANLGGIQDYNPSVKKSYYTTDLKEGEGSGRVCEFHGVGVVNEVATEWRENEGYTLKIVPVEKIPFFKEGNARFTLKAKAKESTLVHVYFEYSVKGAFIGAIMNKLAIKAQFAKGFEGILKGLKRHLEEGKLIESPRDLKGYQVELVAI